MGKAVANATNAAQGWRKPGNPAAQEARAVQSETPTMGKAYEGTCGGASWQKKHKGNKYRGSNDDGSRQTRRRAGGMNSKHTSRHTRGK